MSERTNNLLRELAASIREDIGALPSNVLTLAEEIKAARTCARMSLQEVADRSGFTKSHVWEVEHGRSRNPTVGMIHGLSRALGVPFLRLAQASLNTALRDQSACAASDAPQVERASSRDDHETADPADSKGGER